MRIKPIHVFEFLDGIGHVHYCRDVWHSPTLRFLLDSQSYISVAAMVSTVFSVPMRQDVNSDLSLMKIAINSRARIVAQQFVAGFGN